MNNVKLDKLYGHLITIHHFHYPQGWFISKSEKRNSHKSSSIDVNN